MSALLTPPVHCKPLLLSSIENIEFRTTFDSPALLTKTMMSWKRFVFDFFVFLAVLPIVYHDSALVEAFPLPTKSPFIKKEIKIGTEYGIGVAATTTVLEAQKVAKGVGNKISLDAAIEPPLARAVEIATIVTGKLVSPFILSVVKRGVPKDWESFWAQQHGNVTNGRRIALALEELGPTYVKFGQALASRPDVIPQGLATALSSLQDNMKSFDTTTAKSIIRHELSEFMEEHEISKFLATLTDAPVAAASVGQVYKGYLPEYGVVAVKVQRPGIRSLVEKDAALLRALATWAESIPALPSFGAKQSDRFIATELVDAVDEFMSRIIEELDYHNEAANVAIFASLYCQRVGTTPMCVVPEIFTKLCTTNVLIMEWIEGTKLTALESNVKDALAENAKSLEVVRSGIACTLSQLLETGVLHADPHGGKHHQRHAVSSLLLKANNDTNTNTHSFNVITSPGNLLKVDGKYLGYLDFGLLSSVPTQVRDGLVCATVELVFSRDIEAVANLFGELQLLPKDVLDDPIERAALIERMEITMDECLEYPGTNDVDEAATPIPTLKFDKLLDALVRLVPRFRFQLPPYFINNARAMSTLEGIARSLDSKFNVLQVMYPFALNLLLTNPNKSQVVDRTLQKLVRSPSGRIERRKIAKLLQDSALITGYSQRKVLQDIMKTKGGRHFALSVVGEHLGYYIPFTRSRSHINKENTMCRPPRFLQL